MRLLHRDTALKKSVIQCCNMKQLTVCLIVLTVAFVIIQQSETKETKEREEQLFSANVKSCSFYFPICWYNYIDWRFPRFGDFSGPVDSDQPSPKTAPPKVAAPASTTS